ncbi:7904_t:CDS:2, partial [Ambispora leptoticha]
MRYFYLCISVPLDIIDNQDDVWGKVISLNPDVHTFMTSYNPDGSGYSYNIRQGSSAFARSSSTLRNTRPRYVDV